MWWWNGWYMYGLKFNIALQVSPGSAITSSSNNVNNFYLRLYAPFDFYVKNEWFEWAFVKSRHRLELFDITPLNIYISVPYHFYSDWDIDTSDWNNVSYVSDDKDSICYGLNYYLQLLDYKTKYYSNVKTCKQTYGSLLQNDFELDLQCAYDHELESEWYSSWEWGSLDLFEKIFVTELDIIDAADYANDWGTQSILDVDCIDFDDDGDE